MPELPEVETVVRSLLHLAGQRILNAEFRKPRVLIGDAEASTTLLQGREITAVARHGKFIVFALSPDAYLVVHLGMTGKLLLDSPLTKHTHAIFTLSGAVLQYEDIRQFGRIECSLQLPARVASLGPDALSIHPPAFIQLLRARRTRIKPLLLNQALIRGLGNIYVDESLFRAGIHPMSLASRLSKPRIQKLIAAIEQVLAEAIASKGSSISDYVDAEGSRGSFQEQHRVYRRTGQPCVVCGTSVKRILVVQRGTHFCPTCQRR